MTSARIARALVARYGLVPALYLAYDRAARYVAPATRSKRGIVLHAPRYVLWSTVARHCVRVPFIPTHPRMARAAR